MADYKVIWEIEVEADNPTEAARLALEMHQDKRSTAKVFGVIDMNGDLTEVDLDN